jgi:hypothetical protein
LYRSALLLILLLLLLGGHLNSGDGKALLLSMASGVHSKGQPTPYSDDKTLGLFVSSSPGEVVRSADHKAWRSLMICVLVDGEKPIISPSITLLSPEGIHHLTFCVQWWTDGPTRRWTAFLLLCLMYYS